MAAELYLPHTAERINIFVSCCGLHCHSMDNCRTEGNQIGTCESCEIVANRINPAAGGEPEAHRSKLAAKSFLYV